MSNSEFGILTPLFSLPNKYGIGDLGPETYQFIDLLSQARLGYWQLLPLSPLNHTNSPYQTLSSFGIDPIYISLDLLIAQGYPAINVAPPTPCSRVDYDTIRKWKLEYLRLAFFDSPHLGDTQKFEQFIRGNDWPSQYGTFMALRNRLGDKEWYEWNGKERDLASKEIESDPDCLFYIWTQFVAHEQFMTLKVYAEHHNVKLIGDVPIYPSFESVDIYAQQKFFMIDGHSQPLEVGGVPPDYFSKTGQIWGNPLWNWKTLKKVNFFPFNERLVYAASLFDMVRIDHFRALDTYYAIPYGAATALGKWKTLNGYAVLQALYKTEPAINLLAEDLGDITDGVTALRRHFKIPGMKVVQFSAFHDFDAQQDCVHYTGSHDNEPLLSWYEKLDAKHQEMLIPHHLKVHDDGEIMQGLITYMKKHHTFLSIFSIVDILALKGPENRINTPNTVGPTNWTWRFTDYHLLTQQITKYFPLSD